MRFGLTIVLVALVAALAGPWTGAARADTLNWTFSSEHPSIVDLEFYSQDRNHVWPGNNKVYVIDDYAQHSYSLSCSSGERICYGAWVRGNSSVYWGAGMNDAYGCSTCCAVCGSGAVEAINLKP